MKPLLPAPEDNRPPDDRPVENELASYSDLSELPGVLRRAQNEIKAKLAEAPGPYRLLGEAFRVETVDLPVGRGRRFAYRGRITFEAKL